MAPSKDTEATGPKPVAPTTAPGTSAVDAPFSERSIDSLPNSVPPAETLARSLELAASATNDKAPRR